MRFKKDKAGLLVNKHVRKFLGFQNKTAFKYFFNTLLSFRSCNRPSFRARGKLLVSHETRKSKEPVMLDCRE